MSGTVTRHGVPVSRVVVHFVPEHGRPSWGLTDPEGHYSLNYERGRDGALTGTHQVWIEFRPTSPKEEADYHQGVLKLDPDFDAALQKYAKQSSPLTREVKENDQVIDLHLD